ncbi:DUF4833 domain-containing protein [Winogradskyella sp. SYSU M77433]|uniref:DUF4833 domain-containing protein n=1 Tax=Winogradskyella sp. SYSU M77433 TaxID=3042722 RepID=UPI002480D3E6|nr:DUF4833 domain-containing protein [Winogradskyella sp. SYSU M77433]MDH7912914.1 DUF4833 domain-containing protein [Winogradskyella sp. SYSU M77433]
MNPIYSFFFSIVICTTVFAQKKYPVPEKTSTRLFYIQHSKNHNTYVYDVKMEGDSINLESSIDEYRIVYTEGGVKKPLSNIQKQFAYGMDTKIIAPNLIEMHLAASSKLKFYLTLNTDKKPRVYITINNRKLYLENIFVELEDSSTSIKTKAKYVLFSGKDFISGATVTEKLIVK